MGKFTPGPWRHEESLFHWIRAGKKPIAIMKTPGTNVINDARLIAAAPDLLEAGIGVLGLPGEQWVMVNQEAYFALAAAIAKARGEEA